MATWSRRHCPPERWYRLIASSAWLPAAAFAAAPLDLAQLNGDLNLSLMQGPGPAERALDLYLEVVLNGVHTRRVVHFAQTADGRFLAWPDNLRNVGLQLGDGDDDRYIDLASLPGIAYRYDAPNQRMLLDASDRALNLQTQRLNARRPPLWPARSDLGAVLNYDLYTVHSDGETALSAATRLRAFDGFGVLESSGISQFSSGPSEREYVRLDTTWTFSLADQLWTVAAGDLVSGSLAWSRSVRLGGVQVRRNFALQPGLLTYPLPQFYGQAALPSEVELYVNGVRQYQGTVLPGPFAIEATPGVTGVGTAQVVVTDALGRSRSIAFDFYSASRLLRAGLSDYSAELGAVRRGYGLDSFSYRHDAAASASLRYGLSDRLTLESHAEAGHDLAVAGAGVVLGLQQAGTVAGAYAASAGGADPQDHGGQISADYSWTGGGLSLGYGLTRTHGEYRDIASLDGRLPSQRSERALLAYGLGRAGNVSVNYARLDTKEEGRYRVVGAQYSLSPWSRLAFYVGGSINPDDGGDGMVFAGLSLALDRRLSANASFSRRAGSNRYGAGVGQSIPGDGGSGWRLLSQRGDGTRLDQAEAGYRGDHGEISGGVWSLDGDEHAYADLRGAVVLMAGSWFTARQVDDSFALVSADGVAGVTVLKENRPVGRTDRNGHYLITGLNSYQPNRIGIEPLDVPLQLQVGAVSQQVVPSDRAGVVAAFRLQAIRGALLILHDAAGEALPLGSRVVREADTVASAVVGYDGQVYLDQLAPFNHINVRTPDGTGCDLDFVLPEASAAVVIGPLRCELKP